MSESTHVSELRPSYRTLNEPTKLIGLSLAAWATMIVAAAIGYAFLAVSPLPWRFNFSVVVVGLGAPVGLIVLREPGTIGPGRLLAAVLGWRLRSPVIVVPDAERPVTHGAVRLDAALGPFEAADATSELPWTVPNDSELVR